MTPMPVQATMTPMPVQATIHITINGKPSEPLATVKLTDPATANWDLAAALREVAAELEAQHLAANFDE